MLHAQIRSFHRQKALLPEGLRFGVQQQGDHGVVRTITASLVSTPVRPCCLDAYPIPAVTNEMGSFMDALRALVAAYAGLDLFRVVMYDAGACSEANARGIRDLKLQYVMQLTDMTHSYPGASYK